MSIIWISIIGIIAAISMEGLLAFLKRRAEKRRKMELINTKEPQKFVELTEKLWWHGAYPKSKIVFRIGTDVQSLTIAVDLMGAGSEPASRLQTFHFAVAELVPMVLAQFPVIGMLTIVGNGSFVDIRGHSSYGPYARIEFLRSTSDGINWQNIDKNNLPKLADKYWVHSSLIRKDKTDNEDDDRQSRNWAMLLKR